MTEVLELEANISCSCIALPHRLLCRCLLLKAVPCPAPPRRSKFFSRLEAALTFVSDLRLLRAPPPYTLLGAASRFAMAASGLSSVLHRTNTS